VNGVTEDKVGLWGIENWDHIQKASDKKNDDSKTGEST